MKPELVRVDKQLPTPAYLQLKQQLGQAIHAGTLRPGSALPSERELADDLGLSRMTVRRAFEELVHDGLIEQRQGSGTYVRAKPVLQIIDRVLGFTDEARHLGFRPGSTLIEAARQSAQGDVAAALQVSPGTPVLRVTRLRTADGAPLALQTSHLGPTVEALSLERLGALGSLYGALEAQFGVRPARARQTISARLPSRHERALLEIPREVPVLWLERTTYGADGAPFEFARSAYRGDRYRMALDLRAPDA